MRLPDDTPPRGPRMHAAERRRERHREARFAPAEQLAAKLAMTPAQYQQHQQSLGYGKLLKKHNVVGTIREAFRTGRRLLMQPRCGCRPA